MTEKRKAKATQDQTQIAIRMKKSEVQLLKMAATADPLRPLSVASFVRINALAAAKAELERRAQDKKAGKP